MGDSSSNMAKNHLCQDKKRRGTAIPRLLRQAIIQDYLSDKKSSYMLSIEHGGDQKNINKMVHRYQQEMVVS